MVANPTISELITRANSLGRPILLYIVKPLDEYHSPGAAYTIPPSSDFILDELFLHIKVLKTVGHNFVYRLYERGTATGDAAAAQLGINTEHPALVVLTSQGDVHMKWIIESPAWLSWFGPGQFIYHLEKWANEAKLSNVEVFERANAAPRDTEPQILAAQRAWAASKLEETVHWLSRVERADQSKTQGVAARAAWNSVVAQLAASISENGRALARDYLRRYPAYGMPAVRLLAASGEAPNELDSAIAKVLKGSSDDDVERADPRRDTNGIVFDALRLGALDAALSAAETQVRDEPDNANAHDTLAQVYAARGEYTKAISAAERGLAMVDDLSSLADFLRATLRHARGGSAATVKYTCRRDLLERILAFPGENLLFSGTNPELLAREALTSAIREVAVNCLPGDRVSELTVRIDLAHEGEPITLRVLSPALDELEAECIERAASGIRSPIEGTGISFAVTVPMSDRR